MVTTIATMTIKNKTGVMTLFAANNGITVSNVFGIMYKLTIDNISATKHIITIHQLTLPLICHTRLNTPNVPENQDVHDQT